MNAPTRRAEPKAGPTGKRIKPLDLLRAAGLGKLLRTLGLSGQDEDETGLLDLAAALLSLRGRASGPALASAFFDLYERSEPTRRQAFLARVHDRHPADAGAIEQAIARWRESGDENAAMALNEASESPMRRLIGQLNLASQGTRRLIQMREDLLAAPDRTPGLKALDRELEEAFAAWFNAGFLELRRIGWNSPAALLERIIRYEAVHAIHGWEDLRRRVEPADRRCYAFFHPQMPEDPLIFVEVALTDHLPGAIHEIIAEQRTTIDPHKASHAIFYSISNCQPGLKGVPFGNYLIKRVVGLLRDELPQLKTFATLSPVPGFAKWLGGQPEAGERDGAALRRLAARYLVEAKAPSRAATKSGQPLDPVARFHLGNGARLEAIHADADLSPAGQRQAHGVMVNYLYDLGDIEANYFALTELGTVAASKAVLALLDERADQAKRDKPAGAADSAADRNGKENAAETA